MGTQGGQPATWPKDKWAGDIKRDDYWDPQDVYPPGVTCSFCDGLMDNARAQRINSPGLEGLVRVTCPNCGHTLLFDTASGGR